MNIMPKFLRFSPVLLAAIGLCAAPLAVQAKDPAPGERIVKTGEVVDLMCYLDHGAKGDGHAQCARTCIGGGGPVGLLTEDGDVYLLIGDHAPANDKLVEHAAKTITVDGKFAMKGGMKMIENIKIKG